MAEESVKKRGWVKNAAIIFLSILLVLTFFSNTILNRSLPEVAVEYAQPGTITAKIRGTGTVSANESYQVTLNGQTREVRSVAVQAGDAVAPGDLLFTLADTESEELKTAQNQLEELQYQYREAVIDGSSADYAAENRKIEQAQAELNEALAERADNEVSESALFAAEEEVHDLTQEVAEYQREIEAAGGSSVTSSQLLSAQRAIEDKEAEIQANMDALTAAETRYANEWSSLRSEARARMAAAGESGDAKLRGYLAQVASEWDREGAEGSEGYMTVYTTITGYLDAADALDLELARLEEDYHDLVDEYEESAEVNELNERLLRAQSDLADAQAEYEDLKAKRTAWSTANEAVKTAQATLDDLVFSLSEQQKEDGKTTAKHDLSLERLRGQIADAQEEVARLQADSVDATITAPVGGIVTAVNITAGNTTSGSDPLAVIEVPDMGYSLSFAVTNEQASKVKVGDMAEVSNYYWGGNIQAQLVAIRNDPEQPGRGRLLQFALSGEVETGSSLTLSVGQQSAEYSSVVPNSALRSDSNGDFILTVTSKQTPLGTRYTATRVDVQVLATDDTRSAISGAALTGWDYVITTATKPVEPGMLVRLVEN